MHLLLRRDCGMNVSTTNRSKTGAALVDPPNLDGWLGSVQSRDLPVTEAEAAP